MSGERRLGLGEKYSYSDSNRRPGKIMFYAVYNLAIIIVSYGNTDILLQLSKDNLKIYNY